VPPIPWSVYAGTVRFFNPINPRGVRNHPRRRATGDCDVSAGRDRPATTHPLLGVVPLERHPPRALCVAWVHEVAPWLGAPARDAVGSRQRSDSLTLAHSRVEVPSEPRTVGHVSLPGDSYGPAAQIRAIRTSPNQPNQPRAWCHPPYPTGNPLAHVAPVGPMAAGD